MSSRHRVAAYLQVMRMAAREDSANPARIAGSVALGVGRILLIIAIYSTAYALTTHSSLPLSNAMWSIGAYFALIVGLGIRNVYRVIEKEVQTGVVETALIKPLDFRLVKLSQQFGKNVFEFVALALAFAVTLLLAVGLPDLWYVTWGFVAGYVLLVGVAVVTTACIFTMVGLVAFWMNEAASVYRIVDRSIIIFAGGFVPIALLPDALQTFLRYSPFSAISASTQFFNPGLAQHLGPTLAASLGWVVVFVVACQLVWKRVQRRIEVNGG